MKHIRKTLAFVFALAICLSMLPATALAEGKLLQTTKTTTVDISRDAMLTFSADTPFTLATANGIANWNGTLEYFTGSGRWEIWDGTTISSGLHNGRQVLYLRGTGNTRISTNENQSWVLTGTGGGPVPQQEEPPQRWQLNGPNITCSGNIESLLSYMAVASGTHPDMDESCFACLFLNCKALVTAPKLPATELADGCYWGMFSGCTSLTRAPELPATTLAVACYSGMFANCTSLRAAPALPATTLTDGCYWAMFQNCASLTAAPALPATTLANGCYMQMFENCTSLTTAPALPATALAEDCYEYMFKGCASLTAAPALPATTLTDECYMRMFEGCTSLAIAPELSATTLAAACCKYMFAGCTSLAIAPELPATTLADECYYGMFVNCTSLIAPPALPATNLPEKCYYCMFIGCTGIRLSDSLTDEYNMPYRVPSVCNPQDVGMDALSYMFSGTGGSFAGTALADKVYYLHRSVSQLGDGMLTFSSDTPFTLRTINNHRGWDGTLQYSTDAQTWTTWNGATTLNSAAQNGQQKLYLRGIGNKKIVGAEDYCWVLTGSRIACSGNIENLLDYATVAAGDHPLMTSWCYAFMFKNCSALTDASKLQLPAPDLTRLGTTYLSMFESCTSLTAPPALPAEIVGLNCYSRMFKDCTSLTTAPALPATTLNQSCYEEMFYGCASLTTAPALPATTLEWKCYKKMFSDCYSLTGIPALPATTLPLECYEGMFMWCCEIRLASVQTNEYNIPYRLPSVGTVEYIGTDALSCMFYGTNSSYNGPLMVETTYYLHNSNSVIG